MTTPRPNVRRLDLTCPNCLMSFKGNAPGLCPRCLSVDTSTPSPTVCWLVIAAWTTVCALAITGVWWLVTR